jgi:hypothetical protein
MQGSTNEKIAFQASLGINWDSIKKITMAKGFGSMAQVVEYLHNEHEFNPQYHSKWINKIFIMKWVAETFDCWLKKWKGA